MGLGVVTVMHMVYVFAIYVDVQDQLGVSKQQFSRHVLTHVNVFNQKRQDMVSEVKKTAVK